MEMEEFNCIGEYRNVISQDDCDVLIDLFEQIDQKGGTHQGVVKRMDGGDELKPSAKESQDLILFRGSRRERVLVALLYLNTVEEGGETLFCHQNFASKPEAGKLVIFPAGFTHVHKGQCPVSNDKYIINGWIVEEDHWLPSEPDIP